MSILQVAAPGMAGGLESVLLNLASGLQRMGHRTALAAVLDPVTKRYPVTVQAAGLGIEVLRLVVPQRAYLREFHAIRHAIETHGPDIVHTHGYRADLIGGLAAQAAGVPWVSTAHGFTGGGGKNRIYEWLQVQAYRRAEAVIAVSQPIRRRLAREGVPIPRIHFLPNAWSPRPLLLRTDARRHLGLGGGNPIIGWVGRLTREKGADIFLEALARLPHRAWDVSIIGDGRERQPLEAHARALGIADRVRWHGLVSDAASVYSAFDAWVLSSRTEGTPIALFEAMAARVPVVATSVGGVPDVVSPREALLVPTEHPEALAAALASILSDPISSAIRADAAHLRLQADFAAPAWLDAHVSLYRAIAHSRREVE